MIQMASFGGASGTKKQELFGRLIHLADALYGERQVTYGDAVRLFREKVTCQWHERTIRRDLDLLVEFGWLESIGRGVYRVVHEHYPSWGAA